MSETISWTVPEGAKKERADKALSSAFEEHSRSDFHRAFEAGLVTRSGKPLDKKEKVVEGDVVVFRMPDVETCPLGPVDMDLSVIFEDEHLVVIDKPSGLVVHPGAGMIEPTLVHGLLHHCQGELSGIGGVERPGIVHRLDKETTGLIAVAKTDAAHRGLSELFQERALIKEYVALVTGTPGLLSGSINKPIERNPTQRHKMRIATAEGKGREAHTDWKIEQSYGAYTLVRCRIHTGRTHQIRVHMRHLGHAILGDPTYGYRDIQGLPAAPPRVLLHSVHLAFEHPVTGEDLDLTAPMPKDFLPYLK